jgi:hypothetical protein
MISIPANMILVLQGAVILSIISAKMLINDPYLYDRFARRFASGFFGPRRPKTPKEGGA